LQALGAHVTVYDPIAIGNAVEVSPGLGYADSALEAARQADVVLVVTAWPEFADINPRAAQDVTTSMTIVDVCQGIANDLWREAGWTVLSLTGK